MKSDARFALWNDVAVLQDRAPFQRDDSDLDRYRQLNDTAYLDVGDAEAVARAVWGDDDWAT